jgi:hypothetical protein
MPGTRLNRWRSGFVVGGAIRGWSPSGAMREGRVQAGSFPGGFKLPQTDEKTSHPGQGVKNKFQISWQAVIRSRPIGVNAFGSQESSPRSDTLRQTWPTGSRSPDATAASLRGGLSFILFSQPRTQLAERTASSRDATRGSLSCPALRARTRQASDLRMTPSERTRR